MDASGSGPGQPGLLAHGRYSGYRTLPCFPAQFGPVRPRGHAVICNHLAVRLVVATRNEHKLRELVRLMRPHELEPLPDDVELPPETGTTFADNQHQKPALSCCRHRLPAIADDSGIEAAALNGPGVYSARYAGDDATDEENLAKLLREVPPDGDTRVAYVCAMAYVEPGGRVRGNRARAAARGKAHARVSAAAAVLATTRRSSPTTTRATSAPWPSSTLEVRRMRSANAAGRTRARDQSAGSRRGGEEWRARAASSLTCSSELRANDGPSRRRTAPLSVAAAVALVAVKLVTGLGSRARWPSSPR